MSSPTSEERTYSRDDCIVFRKTNEKFGGLSNMAPGFPLEVNGIRIATSEALYQACRFPNALQVQKIILGANSPMTAKMRSKKFRKTCSRPDWDTIRVKVMRWCLRIKLAQNLEKFGQLLEATNCQAIVEESSKDRFWGAKPVDNSILLGRNILGRLLMELRKELAERKPEALKTVPPLDVPNLLLLGFPIGIIGAKEDNLQSINTSPNASQEMPNVFVSHLALGDDKAKLREIFLQLESRGFAQIVSDLKDWRVTTVKLKGDWSRSHTQDELVLVLKGFLRIHLKERVLPLNAGELFIVRRESGSFSMSAQDAEFLLLEAKPSISEMPQMMLHLQT